MRRGKKQKKKKPEDVDPWTPVEKDGEKPTRKDSDGGEDVQVSSWSEKKKPTRRKFPGPENAQVPLRIAMDKKAYADIALHAKESLDREICGVMVGHVCEDDEGMFIHVEQVVRGSSADESSTQVTFTHETWNEIHETMKKEHPKLNILGWYHSHPGFGVIFSEMDLFIQNNFFSAPTQAALVIDPLGGDTAICINHEGGTRYLDKFWVEGREQQLSLPDSDANEGSEAVPGKIKEDLVAIENRLNHVLQALDEQSRYTGRTLTMLGLLVCLALAYLIGQSIFNNFTYRRSPPEQHEYFRVPVKVGNDTVYLGVQVVKWEVPPHLIAMHEEFTEKQLKMLEEQLLLQLQGGPPPEEAKKEKKGWFNWGKKKEKP